MGSGCPPASSMSSIAFFPWKVTKTTTVSRSADNATYTFDSSSDDAKFDTSENSGRGFAPMAIARTNGGDFCISFSLQLMYRGSVSTSQTSKNFMTGVAFFDSKMNKIYEAEAGIRCDGYPGSFQTVPKPRILPINVNQVNASTVNLRVGFYNGVITFYNGESDQIHEQSLDKGGPISYVALIMRGEGYYRSIFTNVKCAGLTAVSSTPTPREAALIAAREAVTTTEAAAAIAAADAVEPTAEASRLAGDAARAEAEAARAANAAAQGALSAADADRARREAVAARSAADSAARRREAAQAVVEAADAAVEAARATLAELLSPTPKNQYLHLPNVSTDAVHLGSGGELNDVQECKKLCDDTEKCTGFDIVTSTNFCTLRKMVQSLPENDVYENENLQNPIGNAIRSSERIQIINSPSGGIENDIAFNSDDTYIAITTLNTSQIYLYKKIGIYRTDLTGLTIILSVASLITCILFDDQNNLICATSANGIQKFTRNVVDGTYSTTSVQINATNNVTKMAMDKSGKFMVTHSNADGSIQILVRQTNGSYAQVSAINTGISNTYGAGIAYNTFVTISKDGIIFLMRNNSIIIYDLKTNTGSLYPGDTIVQSFFSLGNLIFDDIDKILAYNQEGSNKIFIHTIPNVSINEYEITLPSEILHMSFDPTGIYLAVACAGGKLYVLRKQGNKKFIFTESFNTTLKLPYTLPSSPAKPIKPNQGSLTAIQYFAAMAQWAVDISLWNENMAIWNANNKKVKVNFNPKTRDLIVSSPDRTIKIFKKLGSEEPTRFQSPSPQGTDTYLKIEDNIFENIYVKLKFTRTDPRGGGLKDVLKSIQFPPQSPPTLTLPPIPRLDIDTLVIDFASGNPEFFIIDEDKQTTYSGTVSYNAITYPYFTETPVLAFAISIDTDLSDVYDTFYILTNTINFKSYTIINDKGEDVINLPDNQTVSIRKPPMLANRNIFPANVIWYRQNVVQEIMLSETLSTTPDSISYNSANKRLMFNTTPIICDIYPGNHKVTFKTNANTVSVSSPVVPIDTTIAVFFIHDENTIFLTYVHPSYYTIFKINTNQYLVKIETNIAFTKNNQIDCPFYYIPTSLSLPSNSYLELDKDVMSLLKTIETNLSLAGGGNAIEVFPDDITSITIQKFKTSTDTRSIKLFNNGTLSINDNTISPIRFFVYNGIIIFRDKYGTVYSIVADSTYTLSLIHI